ncbi:MAG: hypothetical protein NTV00_13380 [Methylococcales bacterium]|nr:hypothetical protein [Methylococcales bacterium]
MKNLRSLLIGAVLCLCDLLMVIDVSVAQSSKAGDITAENNGSADVSDLEKPPTLAPPLKETEPPPVINPETDAAQVDKPLGIAAKTVKSTEAIDAISFKKVLNLSLPFKAEDETELSTEQNSVSPKQRANIFAPETKKKPQAVRLDGTVLMTQELEAEKRKSFDGAGIAINVKP